MISCANECICCPRCGQRQKYGSDRITQSSPVCAYLLCHKCGCCWGLSDEVDRIRMLGDRIALEDWHTLTIHERIAPKMPPAARKKRKNWMQR